MSLDFIGTNSLDSRVTFTRGSNATLVDSTGKITYAPANLVLYSQEFDNGAWTKGAGLTVTPNAGVAPDGTTTADNLVFSTGGAAQFLRSFATMVAGQKYIFSVYARLVSGSFTFAFDIGNITTGPSETPTSSWQRFSFAFTFTGANQWVDLQTSAAGTLQLWGAQLEPVTYQTTPSTYIATTSAEYYGPRFDYDPVTLTPKGLLIEEQRTNLLTYSEQFDNAVWAKSSSNAVANSVTSPDGLANGDTLRLNAGTSLTVAALGLFTNATPYVSQPSSASLTVGSYVYSIYVRGEVGLSHVQLRVGTGASLNPSVAATVVSLSDGTVVDGAGIVSNAGGGWYRISLPFTATAAVHHCGIWFWNSSSIASATGNEGIYSYGAQLEAGAFSTSYIPTVASSAPRNADVASMTGTNFSSWFNASEGTFVCATSGGNVSTGQWAVSYDVVGTGNDIYVRQTSATAVSSVINGTGSSSFTISSGAAYTSALAYKLADCAFTVNGGAVSATAATPTSPTSLVLGSLNGTFYLNKHIRYIAYYNTRLSNAAVQTLSA
jgi:hypothetical protein